MALKMINRDLNHPSASTLCVPALNAPCYDVHVSPVNNFNFGSALESTYPLLHMIFSYLTNVELQTVTLVKPSWKEIANEILNKRIAAAWMVLSKKFVNVKTKTILNTFVNVKYSNINVALIIIRSKKHSLEKCVCVHKLNEVKSIPFAEYLLNEMLPKDVKCCILTTSKIYPFFSKTDDKSNLILTSGLFFPVIPKIRTTLFYASMKNIDIIKKQYIQENEQIKALLLFCLSDPYKLNSFLKTLLENLEPTEVALGGGIIKGMKLIPNYTEEKFINKGHYICMAFLENKYQAQAANFSALSVVIRSDHVFSERLQSVKEKITLRSQTVALRICSSRKDNKLSQISDFNKVFPSVPLLSFDCNGEIGWNSGVLFEDMNEDETNIKKSMALPECEHQSTSIIVFLMWGKVI